MDSWKLLKYIVNWLKVQTETFRKYEIYFLCTDIVYNLELKNDIFHSYAKQHSLPEKVDQLNRKSSPSVFLLRIFLIMLNWIHDKLYLSYGIVTSLNTKTREFL